MKVLKQLWIRGLRRARDEYEDVQEDVSSRRPMQRIYFFAFCMYLLLAAGTGIYWSFSPSLAEVRLAAQDVLREQHIAFTERLPAGTATTATLIAITESLAQKPGGYIGNDRFPPGIWLDNMPHWEQGVIVQVRDMTEMLRASFSQASANVFIDEDLQKAEVRFNFDNNSWAFPSTEAQYRSGSEHLAQYLARLARPGNTDTYFFADAQHLNDYLAGVEQRLKNLSQRLTASVGPEINTDHAAMSVSDGDVNTNGLYTQTSWAELDDVFFEARGSSWALIALLQGVEVDFSDVLKQKNAQASFEQIIRELNSTQKNIYSPIILNGNGFGFVVNHSLVMASYISRTQAAIADCRRLLLKP